MMKKTQLTYAKVHKTHKYYSNMKKRKNGGYLKEI